MMINETPAFVHPTCEVEEGASIGSGSKIWHVGHIRAKATIGRDCTIGRNVFVDAGVSVGDRVKIQNNVSVYAGVTIEDEVFVGPSAVFTNDMHPRAQNSQWVITRTLICRGSSIGANATIICGVRVGEYSMIAAGSVVTRDVEPFQLVAGNPARHLGWVDERGQVVSRDVTRPANLAVTERTGDE